MNEGNLIPNNQRTPRTNQKCRNSRNSFVCEHKYRVAVWKHQEHIVRLQSGQDHNYNYKRFDGYSPNKQGALEGNTKSFEIIESQSSKEI